MFNSQFDSPLLAGSPHEDFCFCLLITAPNTRWLSEAQGECFLWAALSEALLQLGEQGKGEKERKW